MSPPRSTRGEPYRRGLLLAPALRALGDQGVAAQRDQFLDAAAAWLPNLQPKFQGIDRAHEAMNA